MATVLPRLLCPYSALAHKAHSIPTASNPATRPRHCVPARPSRGPRADCTFTAARPPRGRTRQRPASSGGCLLRVFFPRGRLALLILLRPTRLASLTRAGRASLLPLSVRNSPTAPAEAEKTARAPNIRTGSNSQSHAPFSVLHCSSAQARPPSPPLRPFSGALLLLRLRLVSPSGLSPRH